MASPGRWRGLPDPRCAANVKTPLEEISHPLLAKARGKTARARYNAEHSPALTSTNYIADLLPGRDDDLPHPPHVGRYE